MPRLTENVRLAEAVRRYLGRMERSGRAADTVRAADFTLNWLKEHLATHREPDPWVHLITPGDVDNFCYGAGGLREGRTGRTVGASYFNRCRSTMNAFFEYCLMMNWVNASPARHVVAAKADPRTPPLMLNPTELSVLMEHTGNPIERIACSLGMNTGLRSNDVRRLTVFDANLTSGELQTEIRKTRDLDVKPVTAELHEELTRWFITYAQLTGLSGPGELPNDWLLVPSYGYSIQGDKYRLFPQRLHKHPHRLVQRPLARMGYPTARTGFHTLRRSSARALFEMLREEGSGRDHALILVKTYLNHASVSQTEVYLGLQPERVLRDELLKGKSFLGGRKPESTVVSLPTRGGVAGARQSYASM